MKTLIVHHLETCWEAEYRRHGTSFDLLCEQLKKFLEDNEFDEIILTRCQGSEPETQHFYNKIGHLFSDIHEYGYGWENYKDDGENFCGGGNHSEIVWIDSWMRELSGEVFICGAFDGECIEDLEIALSYLNINYKRIEELIV